MSLPSGFDRLARPYRLLEYATLGSFLERTRSFHLPALGRCRSALLLGDGDGRFAANLLKLYPTLRVTAVDASAAMLGELDWRTRATGAVSAITLIHADVRDFLPPHSPSAAPDLIVTHFLLDCLTQAETDELALRWVPRLAPDGLWLVSEFRIPKGLLAWPARLLVGALYLAFRVLTGLRVRHIPDYARSLGRAGMRRIACAHLLGGVLSTELWQRNELANKELRAVHTTAPGR